MGHEEASMGVLNVGLTRFSWPLEPTHRKKFEKMAGLGRLHVIGFSGDLAYRRLKEPVDVHMLPLLPGAPLRFCLLLAYAFGLGLVLGVKGRLGVVLSQSPYEGLAAVALRSVLGGLGKRLVVITELHGDWEASPFLYHHVVLARWARPLLSAWTRLVIRRSDLLRAVSQFLKQRVEELPGAPPAVVFPAFTDFELFLEEPPPRGGADKATTTQVAFVGSLYPIKGVCTLVRAMAKVVAQERGVHLKIIGEGPLRGRLEQEVEKEGLSQSVRFLGALSQSQVRDELRSASLLVLPSLSEGLGLAVLEAMACGIPVVASAVGGVPELVEDRVTGFLVPPGDERALAGRILWLCRHEEEARRMGRQGRRYVEETFSTARYIQAYGELLRVARERLGSPRQD